jgi:XTP/dITP diphosphohydrolase
MVKATRIQEKVRGIGFDWERAEDVWNKVEEEINELKVEVLNTSDKIEAEFGDVLFALINYARFIGVQPENALASTNTKFMKRFVRMEELIASSGKDISSLNLGEMDVYWEEAKKMER